PGCFCNRGFSLAAPIRGPPVLRASHPPTVGGGCPVLLCEAGAGCLFYCFSPPRSHFPPCGAVFYLCRHCDRGQRYCSSHCREKARRLQLREANRRHQQSPYGRDDHRDRQREYRRRLKFCVTDQSSLRPSPCAKNETVRSASSPL